MLQRYIFCVLRIHKPPAADAPYVCCRCIESLMQLQHISVAEPSCVCCRRITCPETSRVGYGNITCLLQKHPISVAEASYVRCRNVIYLVLKHHFMYVCCSNIICPLEKHLMSVAETSYLLCRNIICLSQKHHMSIAEASDV